MTAHRCLRGMAVAGITSLVVLASACSPMDSGSAPGGPTDAGSTTPGPVPTATPTSTTNTSTQAPGGLLTTTGLVDLAKPSVVRVASGSGVGSGFVIDSEGYVITNHHVIEGSRGAIEVTLADGAVLRAELVGIDPQSDLAVLKVEAGRDLPVLELADLDEVQVGDDVVAIGYALDLASGRGDPSVTRGIVSAKNRPINDSGIYGAVQTDAAINHGNSGGPLINYRGEVVGVNTALAPDTSPSGGLAQNIGFAVGSDTVDAVYEEIRETGTIDRGFLGIGDFAALRPAEAIALGIDRGQTGVLIPTGGIVVGGPAAMAGIEGRDVIVEIDGEPIPDESALWVSMIRHNPGDAVEVKVYRGGDLLAVDVTLGSSQ